MITTRTAKQCGQADYGWLQARYTFSFGHYFDPTLLGYASLRVLNQEVLAPGASFQPRTYPKVDILNLILDGEAEYRDSDGNHVQAKAGEALLLAAQPGISYSEHNISKVKPLNCGLTPVLNGKTRWYKKSHSWRRNNSFLPRPTVSKTAYNCANRSGYIILRWRKANRLISSFTGRAPICSRFTVRSTR